MTRMLHRGFVWAAVLALAASSAAAKEDDLPDVTEDGLHRVPNSRMAAVYADPEADLSGYRKVQLLDAYVAFRKNWLRDQNRSRRSLTERVGTDDVERIKTGLSKLFNEVFVDELSRSGAWSLVEEAGPNVLRIRPQIVDLDVREERGELGATLSGHDGARVTTQTRLRLEQRNVM